MNLSADVTMQYSPYASIGSNNPAINKDFQNSLNGINLSRVSLDYHPTKDMSISINYFNQKGSYTVTIITITAITIHTGPAGKLPKPVSTFI